jgi:hypothetical protein
MRAFLTGSRVHGVPREDSDIDLVLLIEEHEALTLHDLLTEEMGDDLSADMGCPAAGYEGLGKGVHIRIGKLNLICCWDEALFASWKLGTEALKQDRPHERARAVRLYRRLRRLLGIPSKGKG